MDSKHKFLVQNGSKSLNIPFCPCVGRNALCSMHTTCALCLQTMDGDFNLKLDNVSIHSRCMVCPICGATRVVERCLEGSLISCNCSKTCPKCTLPFSTSFGGYPAYYKELPNGELNLIHSRCLGVIDGCERCHLQSTKSVPYIMRNGKWYHYNCIQMEPFCIICSRKMPFADVKFLGHNVHNTCLNNKRCLGCLKNITGIPTIELTINEHSEIVHLKCPNYGVCQVCRQDFSEDKDYKIIGGMFHHEKCVPRCFICNSKTINPELYNGKIKCPNCLPLTCYACGMSLRKSNSRQIGNFMVHKHCAETCQCGKMHIDPEMFPTRKIDRYERPPHMTRGLRDKIFALIIANKRTKKLDKDSLETLINIMINSDPLTLEAVRERNGIDFLQTCNPYYCITMKICCIICCENLSWTLLDRNSCHKISCKLVSRLIYQTLRTCFPQAPMIERTFDHDMILYLYKQFEKYGNQMTEKERFVYLIKAANIGMLMALR